MHCINSYFDPGGRGRGGRGRGGGSRTAAAAPPKRSRYRDTSEDEEEDSEEEEDVTTSEDGETVPVKGVGRAAASAAQPAVSASGRPARNCRRSTNYAELEAGDDVLDYLLGN